MTRSVSYDISVGQTIPRYHSIVLPPNAIFALPRYHSRAVIALEGVRNILLTPITLSLSHTLSPQIMTIGHSHHFPKRNAPLLIVGTLSISRDLSPLSDPESITDSGIRTGKEGIRLTLTISLDLSPPSSRKWENVDNRLAHTRSMDGPVDTTASGLRTGKGTIAIGFSHLLLLVSSSARGGNHRYSRGDNSHIRTNYCQVDYSASGRVDFQDRAMNLIISHDLS